MKRIITATVAPSRSQRVCHSERSEESGPHKRRPRSFAAIRMTDDYSGHERLSVALGVVALCVLALLQTALAADDPVKADKPKPAVAPADRVVVMYFHRTQRCPTCLRMGGYTEEAVLKGFAKQVKDGTVEFHFIDFQDEKNEALTTGYKVGGPTLVVAKVVGNKVKEYKNLTEIWEKNRDKDVFLKYVRDSVRAYQKKADSKTAMKREADGPSQKTN
jgi:hypothetical protein